MELKRRVYFYTPSIINLGWLRGSAALCFNEESKRKWDNAKSFSCSGRADNKWEALSNQSVYLSKNHCRITKIIRED